MTDSVSTEAVSVGVVDEKEEEEANSDDEMTTVPAAPWG